MSESTSTETTPARKTAPRTTKPATTAKQAPKAARKAAPAATKTAADYRREVDRALVIAAGEIVTKRVPEEHRAAVAQAVANQLHHLVRGDWPGTLPRPARSDWA